MNSGLKPWIALSAINTLPDGHLHSKVSFLKSIINEEQNPEIRQMKQRMLKLSYTVKNIGIHGEEIGITSKRMPMKQKDDFNAAQIIPEKRKELFAKKYLPQNSFFSQALIAVKKPKVTGQEELNNSKNSFLLTASRINQNEFDHTFRTSNDTKFAKKSLNKTKFGRNFSHSSKFKTLNKQANQKEEQFIEKLQTGKRSNSQHQLKTGNQFSNKRSFAKLLSQCGTKRKQEEIQPIQHEQNPLFKKIKKLQQASFSKINQVQKYQKYQTSRGLSRSLSTLADRYKAMISTSRNMDSRKTIYKIE